MSANFTEFNGEKEFLQAAFREIVDTCFPFLVNFYFVIISKFRDLPNRLATYRRESDRFQCLWNSTHH